jgi:hypothetical protein
MTGREQFEAFYESVNGCLLSTVKELHWRTWLAAQDALLSAHGPAVEIKVLNDADTPT